MKKRSRGLGPYRNVIRFPAMRRRVRRWRGIRFSRMHTMRSFLKRFYGVLILAVLFIVFSFSAFESKQDSFPGADAVFRVAEAAGGDYIRCVSPYIIDGDTLDCGGVRIRLSSIDAPETKPCRPGRRCVAGNGHASKAYLKEISRGEVLCQAQGFDHYGRTLAKCQATGRNLNCAMVKAGHAVERYGRLSC